MGERELQEEPCETRGACLVLTAADAASMVDGTRAALKCQKGNLSAENN